MRSAKLARLLADVCCSRSRLQQAMSTALACGVNKWVRDNWDSLRLLKVRAASLSKVMPERIKEEAREITNAPIH